MAYQMSTVNGSNVERLIRYRNRAEEVRVLAEGLTDETARKTLLDIAASYDKLADDLQFESSRGVQPPMEFPSGT
jgi:hypothetical protein